MLAEAIYKGATRPAMLLGIPLVPLVALAGTGLLLVLWGGLLLSWWVAAAVLATLLPVLLWLRWLTARDDQRLHQALLALQLHRRARNRRLWHGRSYSPTLYRGCNDHRLA